MAYFYAMQCGKCRHWIKIGSINGLFGKCENQNSSNYDKELCYDEGCQKFQKR